MKTLRDIVPDAERFDEKLRSGLRVAVSHTITVVTMKARGEHAWKDRTYGTRDQIASLFEPLPNGAQASLKATDNAARLSGGTDAHRITASRARALRFAMGGSVLFRKSVNHPGTKPDDYLDRAAAAALEDLDRSVIKALDDAFL